MKNVTQITVLYYHRKANHISMLIKYTDYNYSPLVKLWDITKGDAHTDIAFMKSAFQGTFLQ